MKQSLKKDRRVLRTKDYVASNEDFSLFLDNKTNIVWTDVAEDHNHDKYYENENYLPHNKKKGLLSFFYKLSQNIMFFYKLKVLQKIESHRKKLFYCTTCQTSRKDSKISTHICSKQS